MKPSDTIQNVVNCFTLRSTRGHEINLTVNTPKKTSTIEQRGSRVEEETRCGSSQELTMMEKKKSPHSAGEEDNFAQNIANPVTVEENTPGGHMQLILGGARGEEGCLKLSARARRSEHKHSIWGDRSPSNNNHFPGTGLWGGGEVENRRRLPRRWAEPGLREQNRTTTAGKLCLEQTEEVFFFLSFFLPPFSSFSYRDPPACGVETGPPVREDAPDRFGSLRFRLGSLCLLRLYFSCSSSSSSRSLLRSVPRSLCWFCSPASLTHRLFFSPLVLRGSQSGAPPRAHVDSASGGALTAATTTQAMCVDESARGGRAPLWGSSRSSQRRAAGRGRVGASVGGCLYYCFYCSQPFRLKRPLDT